MLLGYKPVQHVTVLNTVGNFNTVVNIIILYYHNFIGPPSYMRSVVDRNVVMQRKSIPVNIPVCGINMACVAQISLCSLLWAWKTHILYLNYK
jgi:hypothetical protein